MLLSAPLLLCLCTAALADYELPDEGLPQMQATALENRSVVDSIAEAPPASMAFKQPRQALRLGFMDSQEDWQPVGELDDPRNSWLGQYTDYDRWLFEHYFPWGRTPDFYSELKTELLAQAGAGEGDWIELKIEVDKAGFMLPSRVSWERWRPQPEAGTLSAIASRRTTPAPGYERLWLMPCAGVMPADMRARMEHDRALALAADFPPIPQWLGLDAPAFVVLTTGGEFVCSSAGAGVDTSSLDLSISERFAQLSLKGEWRRYSSDGQDLGLVDDPRRTLLRGMWSASEPPRRLDSFTYETWPDMPADEQQLRSGPWKIRLRRTIDPDKGNWSFVPLYATDLLDQPVGLDEPLPRYSGLLFTAIDGSLIEQVYQAQLELGLTYGSAGPDGC